MWVGMISQRKEDQEVRIAMVWMTKNSLILETLLIFKTKIKLEDMELSFYKIQIWTFNMEALLKTN